MKGSGIILFIVIVGALILYIYKSCADAPEPTKLCMLIPGMKEKFATHKVEANKCTYRDAQGNFMTCEERQRMLNQNISQ